MKEIACYFVGRLRAEVLPDQQRGVRQWGRGQRVNQAPSLLPTKIYSESGPYSFSRRQRPMSLQLKAVCRLILNNFSEVNMLMPKANRVAIYEHLFKEGVMVAEKNTKLPKHPELQNIPNLQVGAPLVRVDRVLPPFGCSFRCQWEKFDIG